jgi:hypothetical protein
MFYEFPPCKCAVFRYDFCEIEIKDTEPFESIDGPSGLLKASPATNLMFNVVFPLPLESGPGAALLFLYL